MKKLAILFIICSISLLYSQENKDESIYILYSNKNDRHIGSSNKIDNLEIKISEDQSLMFMCNTDEIKRVKDLRNINFINRKELIKLIKESDHNNLQFVIVKVSNNYNYILYPSILKMNSSNE